LAEWYRVRILAGTREFIFSKTMQTDAGVLESTGSLIQWVLGYFLGSKVDGAWSWPLTY